MSTSTGDDAGHRDGPSGVSHLRLPLDDGGIRPATRERVEALIAKAEELELTNATGYWSKVRDDAALAAGISVFDEELMFDDDGLVTCPHCDARLPYPEWVRGDCCVED